MLGGGDGRTHDLQRREHAFPGARNVVSLHVRHAEDIDGDGDVGAFAYLIERQRIGGAAVDQDAAANRHRAKQAGNGDRACQRRLQRARSEGRFLAPMQIGRDHRERNLQRGKILWHRFRQKLRAEFLGVELRRLAERAGKQIGQRAGARSDQPARDLAAVMRQRDDVAANVLAAHAGGVSRADQRADRGAGNRGGF